MKNTWTNIWCEVSTQDMLAIIIIVIFFPLRSPNTTLNFRPELDSLYSKNFLSFSVHPSKHSTQHNF